MLKVGIVGIGGISRVHINGYLAAEGAKIVAAADIDENAKCRSILPEDTRFYTSLSEMLENEELDMLDICTPTYLHAEMVKEGLLHGINVICEKPVVRHAEDAAELIRLAKEKGKCFMVAHVVRFMSPYRYLKKVFESRELGNPVHINLQRLSPLPRWGSDNWFCNTDLSGGALLDLSIHDLDYALSAFGEPIDISAVHKIQKNSDGELENEVINTSLNYDGFSVSVTGAFFGTEGYPFSAEYYAVFENGWLESKGGKLYRSGEEVSLDEEDEDTGVNVKGASAYTDEIIYFIDCVKNGKNPDMATPESAMRSVLLTEKIRKTAKQV